MDFMKQSINALNSQDNFSEIPVCAIITKNNEIIAIGFNHKESKNDS